MCIKQDYHKYKIISNYRRIITYTCISIMSLET